MILPARFELKQRLGRGTFGYVCLVYDHERQEEVAVKHLYDSTERSRFKQEGTRHTRLRHPNLLCIHELLEAQGELYIIMEYVPGQDLIRAVRGQQEAALFRPRLGSRSGSTGRTLPSGSSGEALSRARALVRRRKRTATPLSESQLETLSGLLLQLVDGVTALHSSARIHRDLKAENILVTPAGRLVVVDFGLTVERQGVLDGNLRPGQGTSYYMAPENYGPDAPAHALDWYAVGVMLYKLLTGVFPFIGPPKIQQARKLYGRPVPFHAYGLRYPEHWWTLTQSLLLPDPQKRADGHTIRALLTGQTLPPSPSSPKAETLFGRESILQHLEQRVIHASEQATRVWIVEGESGAGKSALLSPLRTRLERAGHLVFFGRCYERAVLPFKALDEALESVISWVKDHQPGLLERLPLAEQEVLCTQYPRLRPHRSGTASSTAQEPPTQASESAQQQQLFRALAQLLTAISSVSSVVLMVDDLQWGDHDSGQLLRFILHATQAHPIVCIGTMYPRGTQENPFLKGLQDESLHNPPRPDAFSGRSRSGEKARAGGEWVEFQGLPPLSPEASSAWAEQMPPELPPQVRSKAVQDCAGHPLFLQKLLAASSLPLAGEGTPHTLPSLLRQELERHPEVEQRVLSFLALALRPLTLQELRALMPEVKSLHTIMESLSDHKQIRSIGAVPMSQLEPYHQQQRLVVIQHTGKELRISLSRILAEVLEARKEEPHALAVYYEDGEVWDRAFLAYRQASEQAVSARSFGQATTLHARALELHEKALVAGSAHAIAPLHSPELRLHHVRLLLMAGDTVEAANELLRVLKHSPDLPLVERTNMQRAAAFYLLSSGHLERGREMLRGLLTPHGLNLDRLPSLKVVSVIASLILIRIFWPFRHWRPRRELPRPLQEYLDVCGNVVQSMGLIDPLTAAWFQGLHMRALVRAGDPRRLLQALFMEVFCYSTGGSRYHGWVNRICNEAERLITELGEERLRGQLYLARGYGAHHQSRWQSAIESLEKATALLSVETVELRTSYNNINSLRLISAHIYMMEAAIQTGDFARVKRLNSLILQEAESKQYTNALVHLLTVCSPFLSLVEDQPERAQEEFTEGMRRWPFEETHLQHFFSDYSRIRMFLYEGKTREALKQLDLRSGRIFRRMLLIPQHMRIFRVSQRGHATLAYIDTWLRLRRWMPRRGITFRIFWLMLYAAVCAILLWLDGAAAARAHAAILWASLFFVAGRPRWAQQRLEQATQTYQRADMRVAALYAHWGWTVCTAHLLDRDAARAAPGRMRVSSRKDASQKPGDASSSAPAPSTLTRAHLIVAHRETQRALHACGIVNVERFARLYLASRDLIEGPAWLTPKKSR